MEDISSLSEGGAAGLAHGNRGRKPVHTLGEEIRKQVVELAQEKYEGFNHQHLTEMVGEEERLEVSRSSVRRIFLAVGMRSPKERRAARHRRRRERCAREGMLLQIDRNRCATKLHERWRLWRSGIGIQVPIPKFLKLLWSRAMVVSVEEKAYKDTSGRDQEGER